MENNFYSSKGQEALLDNVEAQPRLVGQQELPQLPELVTPYIDDNSQWAHAHTSTTGYDYFHPFPVTTNQMSMPVPATMASTYQQPIPSTHTPLQYGDVSASGFEQSIYLSTAYLPSSDSTHTSNPLSFSSYYTSPNLEAPGMRPPWKAGIAPTSSSSSRPLLSTLKSSLPSVSRSSSPGPSTIRSQTSASQDLNSYGHLDTETGNWSCAYPRCSSKALFVRPCDLRKHFNRHSKNFFCRYEGCTQNYEGGFSSKKDRARHESKHNPGVECEWDGCERVFSRVDNMRNHLARIHLKGRTS